MTLHLSPHKVRTATKFPNLKESELAPMPSTVVLFHAQYNHGMADRIACSCVTCPKCGTWVVVRQPSEAGLGVKNSERVARCRSVERNLSSRLVRREFSRYPCHSLNGAFLRFRIALKHDVAPRSR